jgi:hypothetical protein
MTQLKPATGLYLQLLHGRNQLDQEMTDWGFDGPTLGPLKFVQGIYLDHLRIEYAETEQSIRIEYTEDCLIYDSKYFGQYTVFYQDGAHHG